MAVFFVILLLNFVRKDFLGCYVFNLTLSAETTSTINAYKYQVY